MAPFEPAPIGSLPADAAICESMRLALLSAREGNTVARLWKHGGGSAFWELANGVAYLSGLDAAGAAEFLERVAMPALASMRWRGLELVCDPPEALDGVVGAVRGLSFERRGHVLLRRGLGAPLPRTQAGREVVPIDAGLLRSSHPNAVAARGEVRKMWPSEERFLSEGFGFASVHDGGPASWCTAEFVSRRSCGIGIETDERLQGRGHGTAAAIALVAEAERRGVVPHWCAERENAASLALAGKLGFSAVESFDAVECLLAGSR